ncbi:GNAT family N-acetyltransferase [Acidothermaceae bacterium B102]|nr:GNAT family N-acetyltransferase [Acidothermaceae bacterium B102]
MGAMPGTERAIDVVDNPGRHQFEVRVDGALVGKAVYAVSGSRVIFLHTEVDPKVQGQGIAQELARQALDAVRASGRTVVPQCPFIAGYIRRHPDYADLVSPP